MARHHHGPVTLTIPNTQTESAEIKGRDGTLWVGQADRIVVQAPDTLPETVNVHVAPSESPAAGDYVVRGAAVPVNSELIVDGGGAKAMKLVAGGAVAGDRTFKVMFVFEARPDAGV